MGPRSPEGKAATAIVNALDKASISEAAIAYMLQGQNHVIQKRLWKVFVWLVKYWAMNYDADQFDEDTVNVTVNAKRVYDVLERYGQTLD